MYEIYLDDGTVVEANLNANTWESETERSQDVFEDNISNVSYKTPDDEIVELGECDLVWMSERDGIWRFGLNPLAEEEKLRKLLNQAINDISDAVLEMSEIVYGGE